MPPAVVGLDAKLGLGPKASAEIRLEPQGSGRAMKIWNPNPFHIFFELKVTTSQSTVFESRLLVAPNSSSSPVGSLASSETYVVDKLIVERDAD